MIKNTDELKLKLQNEKVRLEEEMSRVGFKNPDIEGDWQPKAILDGDDAVEEGDIADKLEAFEENAAIEVELEARLLEVDAALARIEASTYGICQVCGNEIEDARLKANPAAPTCIAHKEGSRRYFPSRRASEIDGD